jgi:hypothetical protein
MIILNEWYEWAHMARPFWNQSGAEIILLPGVGPFWGRAILAFVLIYTDINKYVTRVLFVFTQLPLFSIQPHSTIQTQASIQWRKFVFHISRYFVFKD